MIDAEAKKIQLWAQDGDRENPEDLGLDRDIGWPAAYEQIGSGRFPERTVFNQLFRELSGWADDLIRFGILPWDENVDYNRFAFVVAGGKLHVAQEATGPVHGNPTDPEEAGQTVWRVY